jgi:hypothetical protein
MKKYTQAEIRLMFPMEIEITDKIISSSIRADRNNNIAATALKTKLPEELHGEIDWGTGIGRISGVPIQSTYYDEKEKGWFDAYLQHANTTSPINIKFIIDNR